ncbi:MAG TPA: sulfatase-like hydrolase/transferase, partial [Thermoleophilaceae bacterium]|nr:sulfatase-like hydrolase/transferase [Thermoleophilaceae bacterium]
MRSRSSRQGPRRTLTVALAAGSVAAALALLALIQAGGDAATLAGAGSAGSADRPNVVVIMSDDQDARSLRVMGAVERRIGEEGTTFTNSFATFPLCCPSRATFLTGQYAHNHGVTSNRPPEGGYQGFAHARGTMPEALQEVGYRTAHIGRYLNGYGRKGNDPQAVPPGWDEWYGFPAFEMFRYPVNHNGT